MHSHRSHRSSARRLFGAATPVAAIVIALLVANAQSSASAAPPPPPPAPAHAPAPPPPPAPAPAPTTTTTNTTNTTSSAATQAALYSLAYPTTGKALTFNAGFSGSSLNTSVWQTCYPWALSGAGCTNFGNSQEEEWYLPSQDQVSGGALHMVANQGRVQGTTRAGAPQTYQYSSGMVTTFGSYTFTYGYTQISAQLSGGSGSWPALWLLPTSELWPPEIDIMENWGDPNSFNATFHYGTSSNSQQAAQHVWTPSNLDSGYHTYGLLWEPGILVWYLDGKAVFTYTGSSVPSQPMYLLANLAIDGPTTSGTSFNVQSVQVYR